jgi:hypothetical protein
VLNLQYCDVQALPEELSGLTALGKLDLSGNEKLLTFPSSACSALNRLEMLKLVSCDVQVLPVTGSREDAFSDGNACIKASSTHLY